MGINTFYCLKEDNYTAGGQYYSKEYDYIEIKVAKCVNQPECKPIADIDKAILGQVSMAVVNRYFDQNDFDEPVKPFI